MVIFWHLNTSNNWHTICKFAYSVSFSNIMESRYYTVQVLVTWPAVTAVNDAQVQTIPRCKRCPGINGVLKSFLSYRMKNCISPTVLVTSRQPDGAPRTLECGFPHPLPAQSPPPSVFPPPEAVTKPHSALIGKRGPLNGAKLGVS